MSQPEYLDSSSIENIDQWIVFLTKLKEKLIADKKEKETTEIFHEFIEKNCHYIDKEHNDCGGCKLCTLGNKNYLRVNCADFLDAYNKIYGDKLRHNKFSMGELMEKFIESHPGIKKTRDGSTNYYKGMTLLNDIIIGGPKQKEQKAKIVARNREQVREQNFKVKIMRRLKIKEQEYNNLIESGHLELIYGDSGYPDYVGTIRKYQQLQMIVSFKLDSFNQFNECVKSGGIKLYFKEDDTYDTDKIVDDYLNRQYGIEEEEQESEEEEEIPVQPIKKERGLKYIND